MGEQVEKVFVELKNVRCFAECCHFRLKMSSFFLSYSKVILGEHAEIFIPMLIDEDIGNE